jgi:hypothetical protein
VAPAALEQRKAEVQLEAESLRPRSGRPHAVDLFAGRTAPVAVALTYLVQFVWL